MIAGSIDHASAAPDSRSISSDRPALHVEIHREIREIPEDEWDSIVPAGAIQKSHAFVRTCQESRVEDALYWHLMIRRGAELVATASISRMTLSLELLSSRSLRRFVHRLRGHYPPLLRIPALFCGLPVSFGQPCLTLRNKNEIPEVARAVAGTMERIASEQPTGLLCWKEFDDESADSLDVLESDGYFRVPSLPACSLRLRWSDFDTYLSSLRATYRRQIIASLRQRTRARLDVRVVRDFSDEVPAIFSLYEQVINRAEHRLERLNKPFFEGLNKNLGERSAAVIVESESRIVAAAVVLNSGASAVFLLAGIDYAQNRACHGYPILVTEVLRAAIRSGASHLEMGQTSYELKGRLGAEKSARWLFLRHRAKPVHALIKATSGMLFPATHDPDRRVFRTG